MGIVWPEFEKNDCQFRNQYPQIFQYAKFGAKIKFLIFGTKNAFLGYCWAGIRKNHCHISNQYPRIRLIAKFREKKCLNLQPKMPYLDNIGLEI